MFSGGGFGMAPLSVPPRLVAAVEVGGTSAVCALVRLDVVDGSVNEGGVVVEAMVEVPTEDPRAAIAELRKWLAAEMRKGGGVEALAVASFGPLDFKEGRVDASSPKVKWRGVDVVTPFANINGEEYPVVFDTDVNAPAMAEYARMRSEPAHKAASSLAYITCGTGVGVGLVVNGRPVRGLMHPEGGHVPCALGGAFIKCPPPDLLRRALDDKGFRGVDEKHGLSVEGVCGSHALAKLAGVAPEDLPSLPDDHPVWECAAHALASCCATLVMVVSPERIVIGGGILKRQQLFAMVRDRAHAMLAGYIGPLADRAAWDAYVVPSARGADRRGLRSLRGMHRCIQPMIEAE